MKVLVTGAGGFLGRFIARELVSQGYTVSSLNRNYYKHLEDINVEQYTGDIADYSFVEKTMCGVNIVIHCAAKVDDWGKYQDFYAANVEGTKNVLLAAIKCGVKRAVYTSTPSVVIGKDDIINGDESLPYTTTPSNFYQKTKIMAELLFNDPHIQNSLETVILRPHFIWGPEDGTLLPRIIEAASHKRLKIIGDGENLVSVSYVENVAHAHILAMHADAAVGKTYFINEPLPVYLWPWLNNIFRGLGIAEVKRKIPFNFAYWTGSALESAYKITSQTRPPLINRYTAIGLGKSHYFNIARAQRDMDYHTRVNMDTAMGKTIAYFNK
jgi:nucleoside-diphosphate-sugar epimerase